MAQDKMYDVLIIGAGAAGLGAALYAARYQMKTLVAGEQFGGETATGGVIENYPGFMRIDGFELMMKMREQVEAMGVEIVDDRVDAVEQVGDAFIARVADMAYRAKTLIITVGRERRKLMLPNEEELTGKGVSYCAVCDAPLAKVQVVAVVGGGDAAVKGALLISKYARHVYLVYRGEKLTRPEPFNLQKLRETENIEVILNTNVTGIHGNGVVESISLDREYNGQRELPVGRIFIEIGALPRTELAQMVGVKLNNRGEIVVDKLMRTSVHGVFAAGDVTNAAEDLKQTITSVAQGVLAATSAYKCISAHPYACEMHAVGFAVE